MVSLPHPILVRHDGPRLMHPLLDWNGVAQLMRVTFQSDVSSGSLPLLPDWMWLRWLQPVLGFFEWLVSTKGGSRDPARGLPRDPSPPLDLVAQGRQGVPSRPAPPWPEGPRGGR